MDDLAQWLEMRYYQEKYAINHYHEESLKLIRQIFIGSHVNFALILAGWERIPYSFLFNQLDKSMEVYRVWGVLQNNERWTFSSHMFSFLPSSFCHKPLLNAHSKWYNYINMNSKQCLKYSLPPGKDHCLVMETEFPLMKE